MKTYNSFFIGRDGAPVHTTIIITKDYTDPETGEVIPAVEASENPDPKTFTGLIFKVWKSSYTVDWVNYEKANQFYSKQPEYTAPTQEVPDFEQ